MDIRQYIDLDTALGRVRGNKGLYQKMLGMFSSSPEFAALDAALDEQQYERAAQIAHGIKGMTGNLGFNPLFEASAVLMQTLKVGPPTQAELDAYYQALKGTQESVQQLLQEWGS